MSGYRRRGERWHICRRNAGAQIEMWCTLVLDQRSLERCVAPADTETCERCLAARSTAESSESPRYVRQGATWHRRAGARTGVYTTACGRDVSRASGWRIARDTLPEGAELCEGCVAAGRAHRAAG